MRDSDPTVRLTQLGIAPRDAKGLVRTLRKDVARMSNGLLPDVAYSAAPGPLLGGRRVISEVVTEAVRENMKGPLGLPVTKEQARFAAVPVIALDPVADEWIRHADRRRLGVAMGTRPNPDFGLLRYREETSQQDNALDPRLAARMSSVFYQAIATGIPELASRAKAVEWTGWALLAVVMALETHVYQLPAPDKDYLSAQDAYRKGMALLVGGGLNLISEGEREATSL
jgi:hypothetical protein